MNNHSPCIFTAVVSIHRNEQKQPADCTNFWTWTYLDITVIHQDKTEAYVLKFSYILAFLYFRKI